ncbi:BglG family transcription antiterminator LicT [Latilactobacillus curvatus]|nr:PRD domain-containing protein [Latilactobacillus curvatus]UTC13555.1 hypothetical protein A4W80_00525 [Latilactobacillus curvatus]
MIINSVINNNVVMSTDANDEECILVGKGIGFKAVAGDPIDEGKIQKKFMLADKGIMTKFKRILEEVSAEELLVSSEIISMAKQQLKTTLNESIYITLPDHIHYVIQRYRDYELINNSFLWDIKHYYPKEFVVGNSAIQLINERFGIELDENESGFLVFHFINAANNFDGTQNMERVTTIIHEIINIVSYSLNYPIETDDINGYRFITHVKFFVQKMVNRTNTDDNSGEDLFELVKQKYRESYEIVQHINQFLSQSYHYQMTESDQLYFMMHIHRLRRNK